MKRKLTDEQAIIAIVNVIAEYSTSDGYGICGALQIAKQVGIPLSRVTRLMGSAVTVAGDIFPGHRIHHGESRRGGAMYRITDVNSVEEREVELRRIRAGVTKIRRGANTLDVANATKEDQFLIRQVRRQEEALLELIFELAENGNQ